MKKVEKDSEKVSMFLNFLREVLAKYDSETSIVNSCDKQTQDILHQIELGPYKDRQKFVTELAHVRQKRRAAKDYVDIHRDLVQLIQTEPFYKIQKQLIQILGAMRKTETITTNQRSYRPRVRNDLTIKTKKEKPDDLC